VRLFVNLLEYGMRIASFLCRFNIPVNGHGLALYWCAIDFGDRDASGTQRYNFALIHDENMAGVFENGGDIRRQELLTLTNTNDKRSSSITSTNQQIRLLRTDNADSICTCDDLQRKAPRLSKIVGCFSDVITYDRRLEHSGILLVATLVTFTV